MIDFKSKLRLIKTLDWKLILVVLIIFSFGIVILSSATHSNLTGSYSKLIKQILAFGGGVATILFMLLIDYNFIGRYYKEIYVISLLLLIAVWIPGLGSVQMGARSWLKLGPINVQTSEVVKLTFILSYAKILESRRGKLNTIKELIEVGVYAFPFLGLLIAQPDLGTALVFCCIIAGMLFAAGLNMKIITRGILIVLVCMPLIYLVLQPHQKDRIEAFLNPDDLSFKGNYQVVQSMTAIGSGGIAGKGLYNGTQNQEGFLPVQDSDFIFAVIGEELGIVGMIFTIILFGIFLIRMLAISRDAKDFYGTLIVIGVLSMFAYQIIQNIGMTVALIPVTGVTLPFVSYGGSSIVTCMANLGLALNVGMRRKKINF